MTQYLFLYGTLQPGFAPAEIARMIEKLTPVGEGSVRGVLYDLGEYPGALVDAAAQAKIFGTVFQLPDDASLLCELDRYEGFNPSAVADSLFVRTEHSVELADGRTLPCWSYVYNLDPIGARIIADGRYRKAISVTGPTNASIRRA